MTALPNRDADQQGDGKTILEVLASFIAESKRQEERALAEIATIVDSLPADQKAQAINAFQTFDRTHQEIVEISEILLRLVSYNKARGNELDTISRSVDLLNDVRLEKLKSSLLSALGLSSTDSSPDQDNKSDITLF